MLKYWRQILFFLHCLIFFLVINLPLGLVLDRVQLPAQIKIFQPSGTLFNGGAGQLRINEYAVQAVRYHWQADCLLSLQWCYRVEMPEGAFTAGFNLIDQQLTLSDLDIRSDVSAITPFIPNLLVQPTGSLRIQANQIVIVDQRPQSIDAVVTWSDLGVESGSESLALGDYRALLSGGGDQLDVELQYNNALLQVTGGGSVSSNGRYDFDINLSSDDVLPDRLKSILELVARPNGYNRYRIVQQGTQPQLRW